MMLTPDTTCGSQQLCTRFTRALRSRAQGPRHEREPESKAAPTRLAYIGGLVRSSGARLVGDVDTCSTTGAG